MTTVTTPPCRYCGQASTVPVPMAAVEALASGTDPVDALALADLLYTEVRLILKGTHERCALAVVHLALADSSSTDGGVDERADAYYDGP